jgi:hypothetical protein
MIVATIKENCPCSATGGGKEGGSGGRAGRGTDDETESGMCMQRGGYGLVVVGACLHHRLSECDLDRVAGV